MPYMKLFLNKQDGKGAAGPQLPGFSGSSTRQALLGVYNISTTKYNGRFTMTCDFCLQIYSGDAFSIVHFNKFIALL